MVMEGRAGRAWKHQWAKVQVCNYHLLRAAFGQGVAIAQVVDLDVLDVVTVLLIDFDIERATVGSSGGRFSGAGSNAGRVGLRSILVNLYAVT